MSISDELIADILRYYHVEKWRVGTISTQLGLHHTTVKRVLSDTGIPRGKIFVQPSMIEPYLPFVLDTLQRYPSLTASRLYAMVRERGYPGGVDHFRHMISCYRPKPAVEAFLRLRTLPGEQAQVDYRESKSSLNGVCHGVKLFKKNLVAFLPEPAHGKLSVGA